MTCTGKIGELALLNDLWMYGLVNVVMEGFLKDREGMNVLIERLRL